MTAAEAKKALYKKATPEKAKSSAWFFKTGPGQYGEGDRFIGVTVPEQRLIARKFRQLPLTEVQKLLTSPIHEERSLALMILAWQFQHAQADDQKMIYDFYLEHRAWVNNWDLVDGSAEQIVGGYLLGNGQSILVKLAKSDVLWDRRIAIIATFHYIKAGDPTKAFEIADVLMSDKHDLIHKAVGWMLREVGKKSGRQVLVDYLKPRYKTMPRTALRYAIEHFDPEERQRYLKGLA